MNQKRGEPAVVLETLPNRMLLVASKSGDKVAVHVSGPMRVAVTRLVAGDAVRIERSPFDATKGRIIGVERGHPERVRVAPNESTRDPEQAPER